MHVGEGACQLSWRRSFRKIKVRLKLMRDLCRIRARSKGEPSQALSMADLAEEVPRPAIAPDGQLSRLSEGFGLMGRRPKSSRGGAPSDVGPSYQAKAEKW